MPPTTRSFDGREWRSPSRDVTTVHRSPYYPYLGEGTVFQRDVSNMPLATHSEDHAHWVANNINYGPGWGGTSLNLGGSGTWPVQPYIVDTHHPDAYYVYMECGGVGASGYGAEILSGWVPWVPWLETKYLQPGQDSSVVIIDKRAGVIREYYWVRQKDGFSNRYTAMVGGYSIYKRGLEDIATENYAAQLQQGSNTVVRMHNWMGWIDIAGARLGKIDHAIAWTCANMALPNSIGEAIDPDGIRYQSQGVSWPAQSGDGDTENPSDLVPTHGQWARLPDNLDLSSRGPYPPFLRMVIRAIQKYGMVATDSNNFVHAFNAEPGFYDRVHFGVDPWEPGGDIFEKFRELSIKEGRDGNKPLSMVDFPWHLTEWAPRHWGAPGRINEV